MSGDYYDENAKSFAGATAELNVAALYEPFLSLLPAGGCILDAGCGSGRDTKAFSSLGFKVVAMDASPEMVALASKYTEQEVLELKFQDIEFESLFDGIWACASLLHVARREIDDAIWRLSRALKCGGILYASFKYGTAEEVRNGRLFNDYTEELFVDLIARHAALEPIKTWTTADVRPGRGNEQWMNALVRKRN